MLEKVDEFGRDLQGAKAARMQRSELMTLELKTGIEIGVYRGGSAYFTTAVPEIKQPGWNLPTTTCQIPRKCY
jgi:hypothetical protein